MKKLVIFLKTQFKLLALLSILYIAIGCGSRVSPRNKTDLEKNIIASIKKETMLSAATKIVGNTLYLYIPTDEEFLKVHRSEAPISLPKNKAILSFFNSEYANGTFIISYVYRNIEGSSEIESHGTELLDNIYPDFNDYGRNNLNKIFYSLQNSVDTDTERFSFIVIYFTDVSRGIEVVMIINEIDLRKYIFGELPYFEFFKRTPFKYIGGTKLIGDTTGKHVDYKDIKITDFIADLLVLTLRRQVRDNQEKPQDSRQEKDSGITDSILKTFYDITNNYKFEDYKHVVLYECIDKKELLERRENIEKKFKRQ